MFLPTDIRDLDFKSAAAAIGLFSIAVMHAFYAGYFTTIGIGFVGFFNMLDVFYNVAAIFVALLLFVQLSERIGRYLWTAASKSSRFWAFILANFGPIVWLAASLYILSIIVWGNTLFVRWAWILLVFVQLTFMCYALFRDLHNGAAVSITFLFYLAFVGLWESYLLGKEYAILKLAFPSEYFDVVTPNETLFGVNIVRSGEKGILYFIDKEISFLPMDQIRKVRLSKKGGYRPPQDSTRTSSETDPKLVPSP